MKKLTTTKAVSGLVATLLFSGAALANTFSPFLKADFSRVSSSAISGSGDTVIGECDGAYDGTDYHGQEPASAKFRAIQVDNMTKVKIVMKHGRPNTLYTVWLRVKGNDQDGNSFGGSPLTNGGATPLAPSTDLDQLSAEWIGEGSPNSANGFWTNAHGNGTFVKRLNFPLTGGAYPFNDISAAALSDIRTNKNANATGTPTTIVDPRANGVSGPFLIRIVSHCQNDLGAGLSPSIRESWFDFP